MTKIAMISHIPSTISHLRASLLSFRLSILVILTLLTGDDEYDFWKAESSKGMKKRMGLSTNPLDNVQGRVSLVDIFQNWKPSDVH
jgi:hypothetical protein